MSQGVAFELILSRRILVPRVAREWKIVHLPVSDQLSSRLRKFGFHELSDLHEVRYRKLHTDFLSDKEVKELYVLLGKLESVEGLLSIRDTVSSNAKVKKETHITVKKETKNVKGQEKRQLILKQPNEEQKKLGTDAWTTIAVPKSLKDSPIENLAPTEKLAKLLARANVIYVGQLNNFNYEELKEKHNFDADDIAELRELVEFAKRFARYTVFSSGVEMIKQAALKQKLKRESESNDFVKNRFQTVSHNQNKQIQPSNSDKRLAESVQALSRLHEKIETHETREIPCSSTDLKELFDFINNFLADLPEIERGVLLERFGGSPIERVLTFEEISRNHQISPEYARQLLSKAIEKLKKQSGKTAGEAIERLIGDCLVAVCPLTPAFLIQITNNTYELFQYPPSFYIRLFGKLNSELPVLPEIKSRNSALSEDAAKLVERIKQYLKNCFLPVSLTEIFNRVMPHNENKEIVERVFFEAIQSPDFVIIESDRKDELLLELKNKN